MIRQKGKLVRRKKSVKKNWPEIIENLIIWMPDVVVPFYVSRIVKGFHFYPKLSHSL